MTDAQRRHYKNEVEVLGKITVGMQFTAQCRLITTGRNVEEEQGLKFKECPENYDKSLYTQI